MPYSVNNSNSLSMPFMTGSADTYGSTMGAAAITPNSLSFGAPPNTESIMGLYGSNGPGGGFYDKKLAGWNPNSSGGSGFGINMDTARLGFGGLQTLGNLWTASQAQDLARKQFDFLRSTTDTNIRNQTQAYNTRLEDRIRTRAATEGRPAEYADQYLAQNRLPAR